MRTQPVPAGPSFLYRGSCQRTGVEGPPWPSGRAQPHSCRSGRPPASVQRPLQRQAQPRHYIRPGAVHTHGGCARVRPWGRRGCSREALECGGEADSSANPAWPAPGVSSGRTPARMAAPVQPWGALPAHSGRSGMLTCPLGRLCTPRVPSEGGQRSVLTLLVLVHLETCPFRCPRGPAGAAIPEAGCEVRGPREPARSLCSVASRPLCGLGKMDFSVKQAEKLSKEGRWTCLAALPAAQDHRRRPRRRARHTVGALAARVGAPRAGRGGVQWGLCFGHCVSESWLQVSEPLLLESPAWLIPTARGGVGGVSVR